MKEIFLMDLKRLRKGKLFYLVGIILLITAFLSNPIEDQLLWADDYAAYSFSNNIKMMCAFLVPILIVYLLRGDSKKGIKEILYTQPVKLGYFALSKFFAVLCFVIVWSFMAMIIYCLLPIYFGDIPYSILSFLKWYWLTLPSILFFISLSSLISILFKNEILVLIAPIISIFIIESLHLPLIFDLRMGASFFWEFVSGVQLPVENYRILLTNRLFTTFIAFFNLACYVLVYVIKGRKNTYKTNRNSKLLDKVSIGNRYFKMTSTYMISALLLIALFTIPSLTKQLVNDWLMVQYVLLLVPTFFIGSVISEVFENKREGFLFVSKTPAYRQLITRVLWGIFYSQAYIGILFLIAILTGTEISALRWVIVSVDSMFLAMLALTAANITRNSLYGYGLVIIYWGLNLLLGSVFAEKIWFMSIFLNLSLMYTTHYNSLMTLTQFTLLLFLFNVIWLSRFEKAWRFLLKFTSLILVITLGITSLFYSMNQKNQRLLPSYVKVVDEEQNLIQKNNYILYYPNELPYSLAEDLINQWAALQERLTSIIQINDLKYKAVILKDDITSSNDEYLRFPYSYLTEFNKPRYKSYGSWMETILESILLDTGFDKIKDPIFKEALKMYYSKTVGIPVLSELYSEDYLQNFYKEYYLMDSIPIFEENLIVSGNKPLAELTKYDIENIPAYLLHYVHNQYPIAYQTILLELMNHSEPLNISNIEDIFYKHTHDDHVTDIFTKYTYLQKEYKNAFNNRPPLREKIDEEELY
ncbi:ABC transporter permease [Vallitalea okinawensis]|uniref:ABC transporter permease n=1 Tax=Vallitalea okinawensis TaxID=2078660 RepID=UPI000CFAB8D0|nr:ABC transporter permease [Vallitalea okinawensis]